jgi:MFS family permease
VGLSRRLGVDDANRKWWTLGAVSFALFMIMLDNTILNVALPSIGRGLQLGVSQLEWVVNAYVLAFAAFMLTGGRLADLYGRRLVFDVGLAVFTVSSFACGLAPNAAVLVAARSCQGAGAALMLPGDPLDHQRRVRAGGARDRDRDLGGRLRQRARDRAAARRPAHRARRLELDLLRQRPGRRGRLRRLARPDRRVPPGRARRAPRLPGLATSAAGLLALVYALIEANRYGWTSPRILGLFLAAAVLLAAFAAIELRSPRPMLDLGLFRSPTFSGANVAALLVSLAMFGIFFFVSLYLQNVLGYSPVHTGVVFLPMSFLVVVTAPLAGRATDLVGPRWPITVGMSLLAVGLLSFSRLGAHAAFVDLLPGMTLGGVGMGVAMGPMTTAALGAVSVDEAGVASGVLTTARQVGGALGIALMGAIVAAAETLQRTDPRAALQFVTGFQHALQTGAAIALAGAVLSAVLVRPKTAARGRSPSGHARAVRS